jgi:acyl-coenzyme A thioesterase PaaI-like protein
MAKRPNPYAIWKRLSPLPGGRYFFSWFFSFAAPYTGSIFPFVISYEPGRVRIRMRDRWRVRNPFKSVHAVALVNLGEAASGLALFSNLAPELRAILVGIEAEYHKKARGTLECVGTAVPPSGEGDVPVEAKITDASGVVVCTVRAKWRVARDDVR